MIAFDKNKLQQEINSFFPCYSVYKEFLDLKYEDLSTQNLPIDFSKIKIMKSLLIQDKTYSLEEKINLIDNLFLQFNSYISDLNINNNILIMPEYRLNTIIPKNSKIDKRIIQNLPDVMKIRDKFGVKLFIDDEKEKSRLLQFLLIPFLFSYQDFIMLSYTKNRIYSVNQHLDFIQIDFTYKSTLV